MIGETILHYKILSKLGEGGMGVVYRAEDTKLDREVAIKFLPRQISASQEERERFKIEAKAAAALNHTNIATVYNIEDADEETFIVMEYIKGQELKDKIDAGPLPIDDTLNIAIQIAQGLQIAHEAGVVHRDIKSSNIMLTERGDVKIMDFGLAKRGGHTKLTKEGTTLGTVAYMSPEQTRGEDVDHRSDIFSLGVLLYEMLTGQLPFKGDYDQAVTYSILNEKPEPVTGLRTGIPLELERVVNKCLQKDPSSRFQHADELATDLQGVHEGISNKNISAPNLQSRPRAPLWAYMVIGILLLSILVVLFGLNRGGPKEIRLGLTRQITSQPGLEIHPTISPDGDIIAYSAGTTGQLYLYVRQIMGGRSIVLGGDVPGNQWPQWSPDGSQIMYWSRDTNSINRIPALGGVSRLIKTSASWGIWSPDGTEFAYVDDEVIYIQSLRSGESRAVLEAHDPHSLSWSPNGQWIAYVSGNRAYVEGSNYIGNLAPTSISNVPAQGGDPLLIRERQYLNLSPNWTPDGKNLLFVSNEGGNRDVYQQPIGKSGAPSGPLIRLTTGLDAHTIHLTPDGRSLAYSKFTRETNIWSISIPSQEPVSVSEATPITVGSQQIEVMDVSNDGQWIAFDSNLRGNQDIYKMKITGGDPEQMTDHSGDDFGPAWSPDGIEIAFFSLRNGNRDLFLISADGGPVKQLTGDPAQERYPDWSPDGKQIVFYSDKSGRAELYLISREGDPQSWGEPRQLTFDGGQSPKWSPDGQLIAFYWGRRLSIISPDRSDQRMLINTDLEQLPRPRYLAWSSDSKLIYYKAFDVEDRSSFWAIPAGGGKPKLLVEFDDPSRPSNRGEFATDGNRFFFTIGRAESDIWVMELKSDE